tara:strand:- start:111 stop:653 length:543 start_codon:yes stop_codon:yes gene_type:complete
MTKEQLKYSLETKELKLSIWDRISHFGIVFFLLFIPAVFVFLHLKGYFEGTPKPFKQAELWFMIAPLLIAVVFYIIQRNRLKFKLIPTSLTRDAIVLIIEKTAKELEWHPHIVDDKFIIAKTHPGFLSGSWGEQITILFDENHILVNSICDPDKKSSVTSMGRNNKNEKKLIEAMKKANR